MSFPTDNNTTPTKMVLSCFGLLVGLWQLFWEGDNLSLSPLSTDHLNQDTILGGYDMWLRYFV